MILIDNGHGYDTPGKRSPDGRAEEWRIARLMARGLQAALADAGLQSRLLVPEDADVGLAERVRRANSAEDAALLVSLHVNAAGDGSAWMPARGWSAYVAPNASGRSRAAATLLAREAERAGFAVRRPSPQTDYWTQSLAICRDTRCPAVLTEKLFMDNEADCGLLLIPSVVQALVDAHARGVASYIASTWR